MEPGLSIMQYAGETGASGQPPPFARAVEAEGWLYVAGQTGKQTGEINVVYGELSASTRRRAGIQSRTTVDYRIEIDCVDYQSR